MSTTCKSRVKNYSGLPSGKQLFQQRECNRGDWSHKGPRTEGKNKDVGHGSTKDNNRKQLLPIGLGDQGGWVKPAGLLPLGHRQLLGDAQQLPAGISKEAR